MDCSEELRLLVSDDVERLLEERGIRREDLELTIRHAESTGEKFVAPATGRSLASLRPRRVTFWVEYTTTDEGYRVHTAYSHRMELKRGHDGKPEFQRR